MVSNIAVLIMFLRVVKLIPHANGEDGTIEETIILTLNVRIRIHDVLLSFVGCVGQGDKQS